MLLDDQKFSRTVAIAVLLMNVMMPIAMAEEDDDEGYGGKHAGKYGGENRGRLVQPAQTNAKFRQECSNCHIAYAPGLLPAESWRKIMAGLDKHFGSDASLTDQENKEITAFLVNNASNRWSAPTAPLRITETAWFKRKHDSHEISPAVWKNPQVKSPANCTACHTQAENGNYSEHSVRIPN